MRAKKNIALDTYYTLISKESGKAIQATADEKVVMFAASGEDSQQWKLEGNDEYYKMINKATGKALDLSLIHI